MEKEKEDNMLWTRFRALVRDANDQNQVRGKDNVTEAMKCDWRADILQLAVSTVVIEKGKPLDRQAVLELAKEWSDFVFSGQLPEKQA